MTSYDLSASAAPRVLVFDVNETLLDIESLSPQFERVFGDADVLRTWFAELILYSMTLSLAGFYVDFFTLGRSVLTMVAQIRRVPLRDNDVCVFEMAMATMPAHPDVAPALRRLRDAGHRLVTLTNSPHRMDRASPLDHSGLGPFFEKQLTVDGSGLYKPATDLYRQAATGLGVVTGDCMLVAAHTWDVIGALGAGMRGALITRPGNAPLVADGIPQPDIIARDMTDFANVLITTAH